MMWTSTTVSSCSRACRLASGILFPFSRVLCQSSTTHGFSASFFKELDAWLWFFPFFKGPLEAALLLGSLASFSLSRWTFSLSLRASFFATSSLGVRRALLRDLLLGPFFPLAEWVSRACSTFFKASSSSCSFSRASAFCFSTEANAFFKASSFSCREAEEVAGGSAMAREVHCRTSLACLLAWEVVPLMACLPLLFTFSSESFLGGITFSSGPPQVGWFFQTWSFSKLCVVWFFQTWKEFFQTLCGHSYNYKRLSCGL